MRRSQAHMMPQRPITLESLIRGERIVEELTPQEAATMLTALAGVQLALANRILTAKPPDQPRPDESKLLKVDDVAAMLMTSRDNVYRMSRRQDWRPFAVRISRRNLRFREAGLKKWIAQRADLNSWEAH
jgi:predicted DNA-binding transcriptional regulator AlpA